MVHGEKWPCPLLPPRFIRLVLPWPPTTNHLYATVGRRRILSKDGVDYTDTAGKVLMGYEAIKSWSWKGPYKITVTLHGKQRRYDIANREKILLDLIFRAIGQDDSLIDDLRLVRGAVDKSNARCEVVIEEANHA